MIHEVAHFSRWVLNNPYTLGILALLLFLFPYWECGQYTNTVGNTGNLSRGNINETCSPYCLSITDSNNMDSDEVQFIVVSANDERKYVRAESKKPHGPYVADAYADVDEEEEEYGDRTDYR